MIKKVILILYLFPLMLLLGNPVSVAVKVLEPSNLEANENILFTDFISSYLSDYEEISLIENENIEAVLAEQSFSSLGLSDDENIELGLIINADYLLTGDLGMIGINEYFISLKLIHIPQGQIVKMINRRFEDVGVGVELLPVLLKELFLPVMSLENQELDPEKVQYVIQEAMRYPRDFVSLGLSYGEGFNKFSRLSETTRSVGVNITGIIGSPVVFFIDTVFTFPFYLSGSPLVINTNMANRMVLDLSFFAGGRFYLSNKVALLVGIGPSLRQKFITQLPVMGDNDTTLVNTAIGAGTILLMELNFSRNLVLHLGLNGSYDFYSVGTTNYDDLGEQSFEFGYRILPKIMLSFNQSSIRR